MRSPFYAAALTLLLAVVGLFGGLYTTEIRSAFPFARPGPHISWPATIFWVLLLVAGLTFWLRQHVTDVDQREAQERLEGATRDLEHLIRTVPNADFLGSFWRNYQLSDRACQAIWNDPQASAEDVRVAIRTILQALAILAWRYDGELANANYGANVMLFVPENEIDTTDWPEWRLRMPFDKKVDLTDVLGVLDLCTELSATDKAEPEHVDDSLQRLALLIPRRLDNHLPPDFRKRWRVLPGAPLAFVQRKADYYPDTDRLLRWCEESGDFEREARQAVAEYFRSDQDPRVGSFLSIPIPAADCEQPLGVVNIHRDSPGLLKASGSALEQFVPLAQPLVMMIGRLVLALRYIEGKQAHPESVPNPP